MIVTMSQYSIGLRTESELRIGGFVARRSFVYFCTCLPLYSLWWGVAWPTLTNGVPPFSTWASLRNSLWILEPFVAHRMFIYFRWHWLTFHLLGDRFTSNFLLVNTTFISSHKTRNQQTVPLLLRISSQCFLLILQL
jgi:hypothetical protein